MNPQEAALVREIFGRYSEMRSGYKLALWLNAQGYTNKHWLNRHGVECGGQPFTYQALYKVLNNPIYTGRIRHKDKIYDGQHEAILPVELWEQVQGLLKEGKEHRVRRHTKHGTLLAGKCFNSAGDLYTPTYTTKGNNTHYRYYLLKKTGHRIKGPDLESLVFDTIRILSREQKHWLACWRSNGNRLIAEKAQQRWEMLWSHWPQLNNRAQEDIAQHIVERIIITDGTLKIRLRYSGITEILAGLENLSSSSEYNGDSGFIPSVTVEGDHLEITIAARFQTYGRTQIAVDAEGKPLQAIKKSAYNSVLINALVKSYRWNHQLECGETTITQLAKQAGVSRTYVARIINLMFLAPDIISAILTGMQPPALHLQDLITNLPVEWNSQKRLFGIPDTSI